MNSIVPLRPGMVPAAFQSFANAPDMAAAAQAGLQASFGVIGFKGRNWRLKYRGEEILVKDERGVPVPSLDVVIVGVSPNISKQWYDKKFTEGDDAAPDCFSVNGVHPDPASPKKQCESCAVCPQNIWGSRITDAGKKGKNCQDSRRVAVVPVADIVNADFGGAMMLRLPPTSLSGFASFNKELARFGAQPYMVNTQLGFDYDVAYPLITFKAVGWLDEAQAEMCKEALADPQIARMLEEEVAEAKHDPASAEPSALAGGAPPAAFAQAQVDEAQARAVAEMERLKVQAVVDARAKADALAELQATAAAEAAAMAKAAKAAETPAPAAAPRKASPFATAGASTPAPAAAAPAPVQAAAEPVHAPTATVVQQAPTDMEAAIDALLAG